MSTSWHSVLIRCRYEPYLVPYLLALLRLAICLLPITGYLHPDEFFQSPDVVGGQYFNSTIEQTWEYTVDKPIRCMLIPVLLNKIAFSIAAILTSNPSAYLLLVAPRLVYTLVSFIIDLCLYKLCQYYSSRGLWYFPVSVIFQTSFICLGCLNRCFSNVIETVIFSVLLVIVGQSIRPRFRILFVTPTRSRPTQELVKRSTQLISSISIGFLLALGTFNRPTFPCFAFVPMLYWTFESFRRNSYNVRINVQRVLIPFIAAFGATAVLVSAFDTYYYSIEDKPIAIFTKSINLLTELRFEKLYDHLAEHWILTPYNFLKYNTNSENLENHGLNPPYTHMLVNIPLAFNVLGLMFYGKIFNLLAGSGVQRLIFSYHRVYALMLLTCLTSTILLSFIPHQEFRFLLPLIVPLTYTFAYSIYSSNKCLNVWLLINLALIYFYSFVHQAGVINAALDLDPILNCHKVEPENNRTIVDVLAFRAYMVPSYQWNLSKDDHYINFDLHGTHEDLLSSLDEKITMALRHYEDYVDSSMFSGRHNLYIMLPSLHLQALNEYLTHHLTNVVIDLEELKRYAPHFSGEDIDVSWAHLCKLGWRSWREAFGFSLLKLNLEHNVHRVYSTNYTNLD